MSTRERQHPADTRRPTPTIRNDVGDGLLEAARREQETLSDHLQHCVAHAFHGAPEDGQAGSDRSRVGLIFSKTPPTQRVGRWLNNNPNELAPATLRNSRRLGFVTFFISIIPPRYNFRLRRRV
jgi:hypothetical protein